MRVFEEHPKAGIGGLHLQGSSKHHAWRKKPYNIWEFLLWVLYSTN